MSSFCRLVFLFCCGCQLAFGKSFNRVASFLVCSQIDKDCNTDTETVAEIVTATEDGMTVIYGDSEQGGIGFVDITDPTNPMAQGFFDMGGEVTSVAMAGNHFVIVGINTSPDYLNPAGLLKVVDVRSKTIVHTMDLGGQPDSVAVSPDQRFAAIAIENERDEDLGDGAPPQMPAGFVVVVDISNADPLLWTKADVSLTSLSGLLFASDPEPEFISINSRNIAVVTLQENNGLVLIDLAKATVMDSFSAGTVDLTHIDTEEEGLIMQSSSLNQVPREPDGVTWIGDDYFATADEGDLNGGSRGFTIYDTYGNVVYTAGNSMEHEVVSLGHYPDERSGNKGNEPENVAYGKFGNDQMLFVNSERSSLIFVYDVSDTSSPAHLQTLPAGFGPEGAMAIPSRNLLIVASEKDSRDDKMRSVVNVYQYGTGKAQYPTLISADRYDGTPIPWSAMSGLAAGQCAGEYDAVYAVEDSFYKKNRIFKIDTTTSPARIVQEIRIMDLDNKLAVLRPQWEFSEDDLAALINPDKTVNIDPEGIAVTHDGFWVVSEGRGTVGDNDRPVESLNMLLKITPYGIIQEVVTLPDAFNGIQLRFGFEGVTVSQQYVVVAIQRAWGDESNPRLGIYNTDDQSWKFVFYPLDVPESQNGGWVGLSDITALGNDEFLVLERDNQGGPDASIKKIYKINVNLRSVADGSTIAKTLFRDLFQDLKSPGGLVAEKVEGMAVTHDGSVWIINDNDGVDDNSGETQFLNLGKLVASPQMACMYVCEAPTKGKKKRKARKGRKARKAGKKR